MWQTVEINNIKLLSTLPKLIIKNVLLVSKFLKKINLLILTK